MMAMLLAAPVVASLLLIFKATGRIARYLTTSAAALAFVAASYLLVGVSKEGNRELGAGIFHADALAATLLVVVAFVGLTAALFALSLEEGPNARPGHLRRFHLGFNLFLASLFAALLAADPGIVFVALALGTLASAFLVSFRGTPEALEAAWKYVVLTSLGAGIALFGFLLLEFGARQAGATSLHLADLASCKMDPRIALLAFVFILVGLGTKIGLVPLHTWLPDAYSQAPIAVCALFSGGEVTAGIYVILRLQPICKSAGASIDGWLLFFGLLSAGVATLLMLQARELRRLLAFSTIEHAGIVLVAAAFSPAAAIWQLAGHALAKSFCFYAAGAVILAAGTDRFEKLSGRYRMTPLAGLTLLLGGLAISGVPPFALFLSELAVLKAGIVANHLLAVVLLAAFIVTGFCAVMSRLTSVLYGSAEGAAKETPPAALASQLVALAPLVFFGLYLPAGLHRLFALLARLRG